MFNLWLFFVLGVLALQPWSKETKPGGGSAEGHLENLIQLETIYEITQLLEIIESVHLNHCSLVGKREGGKKRRKPRPHEHEHSKTRGKHSPDNMLGLISPLPFFPATLITSFLQKPTSAPLELLSDPLRQSPFPVTSSSTGQVQLWCSVSEGGKTVWLAAKVLALKRQLKQLLTSCANILSLTLWYSSSLSSIDLLRLSSLNGRILFCWAERKPGGLYKLSC